MIGKHIFKLPVFLYWLRQYWGDPDAPSDIARHYRARQIDSIARQLPLASIATCFVVFLCVAFARNNINHDFLMTWAGTLIIIACGDLIAWYLLLHSNIGNSGAKRVVLILALMLGLAALLYAQMIVALIGALDFSGQLVLVAIGAGFISTGAWQFASLPAASLLWILGLTLGTSIGFYINYGTEYLFLSSLLVVYWAYLSCAAMVTSKRFVLGLVAETAIEQQRQVVGLLLKDFEENASDWLWEIDALGCLKHVSSRMESVFGKDITHLSGRHFVSLLREISPSGSETQLTQLGTKFESNEPFTFQNIAIQNSSSTRWWSLTAQPLNNNNGEVIGWRGVGTDVTEALLREQEMTHLANVDSLTGLANRHAFGHTLSNCFIEGAELSCNITLLTLDIDNFKAVNDTLGHLAGDELLKEVASRFQKLTPDDVLLARLGGDEFAWVFPHCISPLQATLFGEKIHESLAIPWLHQEHSFNLGASIGVANAPMDGASPVSLQRASDMALYSAKASGKNRLCFYDPKLDEYAMLRLALLNDFRKSFANHDFVVLYQPQIRFSDNALIGFEALVRWHHPERGIVSPIEFIHLIEENGMIIPLGKWVLNQACKDAMTWSAPLQIAVNVSPVQIERSNMLLTVASTLENTELPASRLELELTESSLMCDGDNTINLLNELRQQGVKIALDDFGTGYSSLSYLQRFPFDKLKVDRSFVIAASNHTNSDGKSDAKSILSAILQLAQVLNLETIAEGVETQEVGTLLHELGFENAQGYFYGRPMTTDQAKQLIIDWPHNIEPNNS
ncbi:EAL domain-containing protein [Alteromonas stellipolaris]|uniref:EAL domain-containing protein n=1 Tax=Alteromonas stellipolaris TaxID=233316 RepID=A0AAW7Z4T7_9ALTE|nr:EAL domain-containing protein [Alteromonas stellipolaris]MDO6535667.1 EAL domain-containing protein [Alteromonas stellipolaris]MDO6539862.1 EAL domain-containing protein [Alteromonas stellipolaris]MDO6578947.1 EAL domain-containing protein [Alteromonas stellipolaris]MDO6627543.1 EAL domain-containing protein [Alteromonas stellipolaris]MDP2597028.1 EAL domain-containing protein [Alteromonas stellipolaris]